MSRSHRLFSSLRVRITLAMLTLAAVGSSIFAFSVFLAAERLEQSVLNQHIRAEFDRFAAEVSANPAAGDLNSALLSGYVGRDNPRLPEGFKGLEAGSYHAVHVGDRAYQVYVDDADNAARSRLYVAYDITEWEKLEQPVIYILIAGVVFGCLLAVALGFWTSAQVIAPVTALADRLRAIDPRQRDVRIAREFGDADVAAIAEAFDRYMERLDGFVERERLFSSAAAHELRTPVAVIQGATDVLAEQAALPAPAARAVTRLQRASHDMRELIDALLFLSREDGQIDFSRSQSEVGAIVRQLAEDYERIIGPRKLTLAIGQIDELWVDVPPALPTMVIGNLLRNAIEHTDAGSIQVELTGREVRIADSGRGIPPEALTAVFNRDYSTRPGGGMGLHLSKRICDRCGWELKLESEPGKGTTVSVRL